MTDDSAVRPPRGPSIALGAAAYTVLSVGVSLLTFRAGSMQAAMGCLGCLVILTGPMLAVWHYVSTHRLTLLPGEGAAMGAITGAAGALASGVLALGLQAVGIFPTPAEALAAQRQQMVEQGMSPEQIAGAMEMAEKFGGLSANPAVGLVVGLVFGAALGALFGAVAASVFRRGDVAPR